MLRRRLYGHLADYRCCHPDRKDNIFMDSPDSPPPERCPLLGLDAVLDKVVEEREDPDIDAEIEVAQKTVDADKSLDFYTRARLEKLLWNLREEQNKADDGSTVLYNRAIELHRKVVKVAAVLNGWKSKERDSE